MAHARLAPSKASRFINCMASLLEEEKHPEQTSSAFADEGTAAHQLAEWTLNDTGQRCEAYLGRIITVKNGGTSRDFKVDDDMCAHVQTYVDNIMDYAEGAELHIECKLRLFVPGIEIEPDGAFTGGTTDSLILQIRDRELQVHDLKYGRGVKVSAYRNEQLMSYATMAVELYGLVELFDKVRIVIHQPRLDWLDEWTCTVKELNTFKQLLITNGTRAVQIADGDIIATPADYKPGDKQCRFCKAAATCPALKKKVMSTLIEEVDDLTPMATVEVQELILTEARELAVADTDEMADKADLVPMIESWCKSVMAEVERRVTAGIKVRGRKLVIGDLGDRKWNDEEEAEKLLKSMRLKQEQMYKMKIISPTVAEKLLKKESPRRWKSLQELIVRAPGKPVVVPESDKRSVYVAKPLTDEINDLEAGEDLA